MIAELLQGGGEDRQLLLHELFVAYRFREAYELARDLTQQDADAWTWDLFGWAALMVGRSDQGRAAFAKHAELLADQGRARPAVTAQRPVVRSKARRC